MALVDYSDSDESENEDVPVPQPAAQPSRPAAKSSKPAFQKVVDASGKIRVNLPSAAATTKDEAKSDEPPTKRAKTGGGVFSGFNSFLPPPKKAAPASAPTNTGSAGAFSFKTGAAPGFTRERPTEQDDAGEGGATQQKEEQPAPSVVTSKPAEDVKLVGKPLMFRPLSVARKPKKKSAAPPVAPARATEEKVGKAAEAAAVVPPTKPKVSLFSMPEESSTFSTSSNGAYEPLLLESETQEVSGEPHDNQAEVAYIQADYADTTYPSNPQSLETIASDLKLSAAEKRRLFGRQKNGAGSAGPNIINFKMDDEYRHNEELRAAGEQVTHNPVRSIAPGRHSIRQLINAAVSQKDALEESFAQGKSNRAEAGSKYGW